jgi:HSP20 family protein
MSFDLSLRNLKLIKNFIAMTQLKFNNRPVVRFDNFFNEFFNMPSVWNNPSTDVTSLPAANVTETPTAFQLELNVPGRNKEDFKVNIEKDLLTITYEKKEENTAEGVKSIRREFTYNSFKRSFSLDERIDVANIQAKYENGILKIDLPKKEEVKNEPKQISIS